MNGVVKLAILAGLAALLWGLPARAASARETESDSNRPKAAETQPAPPRSRVVEKNDLSAPGEAAAETARQPLSEEEAGAALEESLRKLGPQPALQPVTEEQAAAALEESVRELRLQTAIPEPPAAPPARKRKSFSFPAFPAWLAEYLLWAAAAAILIVFFKKLYEARRKPSLQDPGAEDDDEKAALAAVGARMDQAHTEAELLAQSGRFSEAIHVLLLQSLAEMRLKLGLSLADSLTSREIVARVALGPRSRSALADIVGRVEVSYFGEYAANAEMYQACRASFETLTHNLQSGGQA